MQSPQPPRALSPPMQSPQLQPAATSQVTPRQPVTGRTHVRRASRRTLDEVSAARIALTAMLDDPETLLAQERARMRQQSQPAAAEDSIDDADGAQHAPGGAAAENRSSFAIVQGVTGGGGSHGHRSPSPSSSSDMTSSDDEARFANFVAGSDEPYDFIRSVRVETANRKSSNTPLGLIGELAKRMMSHSDAEKLLVWQETKQGPNGERLEEQKADPTAQPPVQYQPAISLTEVANLFAQAFPMTGATDKGMPIPRLSPDQMEHMEKDHAAATHTIQKRIPQLAGRASALTNVTLIPRFPRIRERREAAPRWVGGLH